MKLAYAGKTKKELVHDVFKSLGSGISLKDVMTHLKKGGVPKKVAVINPCTYYKALTESQAKAKPVNHSKDFNKVISQSIKDTLKKIAPPKAVQKSVSQTIRDIIREYQDTVGELPSGKFVIERLKEAKRNCTFGLVYNLLRDVREKDGLGKVFPDPDCFVSNIQNLEKPKRKTVVRLHPVTVPDLAYAHTLLQFLNKQKWNLKQLDKASKILAALQL
jgi:hypothetical protein